MRKLKFRLDRKSLEVIYSAFIRPILEYGHVVWDICAQYEKQKIEKKVQTEAARLVTGTTKLISLNLLYSDRIGYTGKKTETSHMYSLLQTGPSCSKRR